MRPRTMRKAIAATASALGLLTASACAAPGPQPASTLSECPNSWAGKSAGDWVPSVGSGTREHLVPGAPLEADICAYDAGGSRAAAPQRLTDGLTTMVTDLNHLPVAALPSWRACTLIGSIPRSYLIRLRYTNGSVSWIGTAYDDNQCVVTTNGAFRTMSYVGDAVSTAYDTRRWPSLSPADQCEPGRGRIGQEEHMVPKGSIGLTVCKLSATAPQEKTYGEDTAKHISAKVDSRPAEKDDGTCPTGAAPAIRLVFRYPQGPPAGVTVWSKGCGMDNRFLRGKVSPALMAELSGLLD